MAQEQLGVCAEANIHGLYLLFNANDGREAFIRQVLAKLPGLFDELAERGETMQDGMEDKFSEGREKLGDKFDDLKDSLTPLSDFQDKIEEVSSKLDKVIKSK